MARAKVAISLDESTLDRLDKLVRKQVFPNRSQAIEEAVAEKLSRIEKRASRSWSWRSKLRKACCPGLCPNLRISAFTLSTIRLASWEGIFMIFSN